MAMARLELALTELRTPLDGFCIYRLFTVPTPGVEPGPLANRASVLPVTPSRHASKNWLREKASNLHSPISETGVLPITPSRKNSLALMSYPALQSHSDQG